MQAMQHLQPQMKRLQDIYKNDRQKLNEETMKLYQENRINPLGGCLPLLLQFPVFISLFSVIATILLAAIVGAILWLVLTLRNKVVPMLETSRPSTMK